MSKIHKAVWTKKQQTPRYTQCSLSSAKRRWVMPSAGSNNGFRWRVLVSLLILQNKTFTVAFGRRSSKFPTSYNSWLGSKRSFLSKWRRGYGPIRMRLRAPCCLLSHCRSAEISIQSSPVNSTVISHFPQASLLSSYVDSSYGSDETFQEL